MPFSTEPPSVPRATASALPPMTVPSPTVPAGTVLIADDEPGDADVAALVLRDAGYDVTVAYTGNAVLASLASARFDVALLNMMMPGPTGQPLYDAVRALPHGDLAIVFMTMVPEPQVRTLVDGVYGYLPKPFTARALLGAVRSAGRDGAGLLP